MTTTADLTSTDRDRLRGLVLPTGAAAFVISSIWTVLGAHTWQESSTMVALGLVATIVVYGVVVPRALRKPSAPGTALTLSVLAVLITLPAFWSGLPMVLGAAGALVGFAGRSAPRGSGSSVAAMLLGILAVVAYLGIYIVDGLIYGHM